MSVLNAKRIIMPKFEIKFRSYCSFDMLIFSLLFYLYFWEESQHLVTTELEVGNDIIL